MPSTTAVLALTPEATEGIFWLGLAVTAAVVVWVLVYRGLKIPDPPSTEMTYLEHAEEARRRILRGAFALVFWFTFFLTFRLQRVPNEPFDVIYPIFDIYGNTAAQVFRHLAHVTVPDGVTLVVTRSTEAVGAQMAVSLFLGLLLGLPFLLYEVWGFFAPALRPVERKVFLSALPFSVLLFVLGSAFAFFYVAPLLLEVLYRFASPLEAVQLVGAGSLVATVATMMALFGLAFQLPLVMAGLSALGIVRPSSFLAKWRHATIVSLILAAFLTDPSLITQLIVAVCLVALWWIGVAAAYLVHRRTRTADHQTY